MMLSPIRFLIGKVKDAFSINNQSFFDLIENIQPSQNIKLNIKVISESLIGIRKLNAHWNLKLNCIEINECLLCALWASSYFIANAYVSLCEYCNETKDYLPIEASSLELIRYAKSLIPSYNEWPENLPKPQDFENDHYAQIANWIMLIATDFVLCHEISHMYLNHYPNGGKQQEFDADNIAISWIVEHQNENYPLKELGVMAAFLTLILIDAYADKEGKHHPSAFSRMNSYLNGLNIDDNDILWLIAILSFRAWEESFNKVPQDLPSTNESYNAIFNSYV